MEARRVEIASDRFLARERLAMFAGSDMPQTIVMKEIIDNEIDVVNERGQKANKAIIKLSPNRLKVMDNGLGISTEIHEGEEKPSIWSSCAKMFSSSNYSGNSESLGANGVGLTMSNYTSSKFSILNFNGKNVKGYSFTDGYLNGTEESKIDASGDYVENPLSFKEANEMFDPFFEKGFLVDVTWNKTPNELFQDPSNTNWLVEYTKIRVGEIISGEVELYLYKDDEFNELSESYIWNKDKESENYVKSWDERVKDHNAVILRDGPWYIAFSTDETMKVESIVQGAKINSRYSTSIGIAVQDENISVNVPFSMKYISDEYPRYTDQTKVAVRFPYNVVSRLFEKSGTIYKHFYREAEKLYMSKVIKNSDLNMFWPSLGRPEDSELIIGEGYSPVSAIKNQRNPKTQACIALRGKILNCWNLEMVKAMRSEIVKQILNAVLTNNYKKIIIAVDADPDGIGHIAPLLVSLFARFTNIIQDKKLYYVNTPHYLFKKGKDLKWSDEAKDCPKGYHTTTLKGLGGMTPEQIEKFILNEETRELIRIEWDEKAEESLDFAFSTGGEGWILKEEE